jgi:hypothetical protein
MKAHPAAHAKAPDLASLLLRKSPDDNQAVSDCCSAQGYRWLFSEGNARAEARRYRRKGLDSTSKRIVDYLVGRGVEGRTVLEVGGGIGAIQIELLKAGAARAVCVELTPTYEKEAAALLHEAGLESRVERHLMDFAEASAEVDGADIVILNRVICCYHDMPTLAGAAAGHAREVLVLSFPRRTWWTRIVLELGNLTLWALRRHFQVFLHRPPEIVETVEKRGLGMALDQRGLFWTVNAFSRGA